MYLVSNGKDNQILLMLSNKKWKSLSKPRCMWITHFFINFRTCTHQNLVMHWIFMSIKCRYCGDMDSEKHLSCETIATPTVAETCGGQQISHRNYQSAGCTVQWKSHLLPMASMQNWTQHSPPLPAVISTFCLTCKEHNAEWTCKSVGDFACSSCMELLAADTKILTGL